MDTVFLTEQANQRVLGDKTKIINKRVDYLVNNVERGVYLKDNFKRPTEEIVYYFPHNAIQAMMERNIINDYIYMILYTQEPGATLDRYEEPAIFNDHQFDKIKGISKDQKEFIKQYTKMKIYQLYKFDSDEDAKEFFRKFLVGVSCSEDTVFFFAKRQVDKFDNYQAYMRDRDDAIEDDDELSEPDAEDTD